MDIIYQLKKNEQEMQEELTTLREELQDRRIRIETAGSIADAAASITNVLFSAQVTADLYLNEITCMKEAAQDECAKIIEAAKKEADDKLLEAERQLEELRSRYKFEYEKWEQFQAELQAAEEIIATEQTEEQKSDEETEDGQT